jgi:hypothetical protein
MGACSIIPVVKRLNAPMKQAAARASTMIATTSDTLSLFLMAGRKNQMHSGISRTPMAMQTTPRTLLTVLIRSMVLNYLSINSALMARAVNINAKLT